MLVFCFAECCLKWINVIKLRVQDRSQFLGQVVFEPCDEATKVLTDWLTDTPTDSPVDWSMDWSIDMYIYLFVHWFSLYFNRKGKIEAIEIKVEQRMGNKKVFSHNSCGVIFAR